MSLLPPFKIQVSRDRQQVCT